LHSIYCGYDVVTWNVPATVSERPVVRKSVIYYYNLG